MSPSRFPRANTTRRGPSTVVCWAWEEIPRPAALNAVYDLMWFRFLDILLHLDFTPPWVQPPAENRHLAFEVEDLPAVRRYLENNGATIREAVPMSDRERFYLLDPFGNYFELIEMHG